MLVNIIFVYLALLTIMLIGSLITSFFKKASNSFYQLFLNNIVGLLVIIIIYSIIKSGGNTVQVFLLIPIGIFLYMYRNIYSKFNFNISIFFKSFLFSALLILPFVLFQFYFFYNFNTGEEKILHADYYLYAEFSNSLKLWGIENIFTGMNYFFNDFKNYLMPYHYSELWLTAFFSEILKVPSVVSYILIVIPIFTFIFFIGIVSLFSQIFKITPAIFFSYSLCFIGGISIFAVSNLEYAIDDKILSTLFQKLSLIYIFILLGFLFLYQKKYFLAILIFLIIPIFSISFFPSVIGGILLFTPILYLRKKINLKEFIELIVFCFVILIGLILFYSINKSAYSSSVISPNVYLFKLLHFQLNYLDLKIIFGNVIRKMWLPILFHLPFLVPLFFIIKKQTFEWGLVILIIFSGSITSALLNGVLDSSQFTANAYIFMNVLIIIGIFKLIKKYKNRNIIFYSTILFILFFLVVSFIQTFNKKNKIQFKLNPDNELIEHLKKQDNKKTMVILLFFSGEDYKKINPYPWWRAENTLIKIQNTHQVIFALGNPELYFKNKEMIQHEDSLYFNHLTPIVYWKKQNSNKTIKDFIIKNRVDYILIKSGASLSVEASSILKFIKKSSISNNSLYKVILPN